MTLDYEIEPKQKITNSITYNELFDYEGAIKLLASERSYTTNLSTGVDKAAVVIGTLITQAKSSLQIFTNNFNSFVYNDEDSRVRDAIKKFLLTNGTITVIMTDYDVNDNPYNNKILALLTRHSTSKNNVTIKTIDKNSLSYEHKNNYIVGDDSMYRLEYNPERNQGEFCFNDTVKASDLITKFNNALKMSQSLDID